MVKGPTQRDSPVARTVVAQIIQFVLQSPTFNEASQNKLTCKQTRALLYISSMTSWNSFSRGSKIIPLPEQYTRQAKLRSSPDCHHNNCLTLELGNSLSRYRTSLDTRNAFQFKQASQVQKAQKAQKAGKLGAQKSGQSKVGERRLAKKRRSGFYGKMNLTQANEIEVILPPTISQIGSGRSVGASEKEECCQIY